MNIQEREQLSRFLQQLTQARTIEKDAEAETLIRDACARQTDAAYLLVQRAMLLDQALQAAQTQVSRLQGELDQARSQAGSGKGGDFLDPNAWGNARASRLGAIPQTQAVPAPVAAPAAASAWGSSMLGNVATTAAGVVAGGFLFQGIEHLLGNHGGENIPAVRHEAAAIDQPLDDGASSTGLFDTSSVDSFSAGDSDSST